MTNFLKFFALLILSTIHSEQTKPKLITVVSTKNYFPSAITTDSPTVVDENNRFDDRDIGSFNLNFSYE